MYEKLRDILIESWSVLGEMGPYLLFGFLVAGFLSVLISREWVERRLGGRGVGPVLKATLLGIPLPLCSCGVIPVGASMYRHGAGRGATVAFLLSTPQTGVDSIAVTYRLLGPVFAVFRPLVALCTGLLGGYLVQAFDHPNSGQPDAAPKPVCTEPCCTDRQSRNFVFRALRYGLISLPADIGSALVVGVLITGVLGVLLPANAFESYLGSGIMPILILMAAGIPMYVCATASVPVALAFMHLGASPGAVLAFLIAGPATNAATITTVWKVLGRRAVGLYLATIATSAVAFGLTLDWLFSALGAVKPHLGEHEHGAPVGWWPDVWAIALLAVVVFSSRPFGRLIAWMRRSGGAAGASAPESEPHAGRRLRLAVGGMTCGHCAASVHRALAECPGVEDVEVDLAGGAAIVTGGDLHPDEMAAAVEELGYTASVQAEI
jgi:uncharacterized membrane protein YraQ (UPF0718 family)/copper chaperone CopZ